MPHEMSELLRRPVWTALVTRHATFAIGGENARRFVPDVGPLAGARDDSPESLHALAELVPTSGTLLLLQADPIVVPPGCMATTTAAGVQMIASRVVSAPVDDRIVRLDEADAPAMFALATLTKPGPFAARTHSLGEFGASKTVASSWRWPASG